jgi:hypothetical protein
MTTDDYDIIQAMRRFGGSFVRALAEAAQAADDVNFAKLKATWPEYWKKYADLARPKS